MFTSPNLEFFNNHIDENGEVIFDDEMLNYLTEKYGPTVIPPCSVCGEELQAVDMSARATVYAHLAPNGVSIGDWQEHYQNSRFIDNKPTDGYVVALVEAYKTLNG